MKIQAGYSLRELLMARCRIKIFRRKEISSVWQTRCRIGLKLTAGCETKNGKSHVTGRRYAENDSLLNQAGSSKKKKKHCDCGGIWAKRVAGCENE